MTSIFRNYIDKTADKTREGVEDESAPGRDPEFIRKLTPLMNIYKRYFDTEIRGFDKLPTDGAYLIVGNHSGGMFTPDAAATLATWFTENGPEAPLTGLAFNMAFALKPMGDFFRRIGEVPASYDNAGKALDDGSPVLVYPGGDYEVYRPFSERNQITFDGRKGFIKLAIRQGVPVYPLVGHGAHNTLLVLTRGQRIAEQMQLDKVRSKIYPLVLTPFGVMPAMLFPTPPLPAKITMQVLDPIDWTKYSPEDAEDDEILERCYEEITTQMQSALDELVDEIPHPVVERVKSFFASLPGLGG